MNVVISSAPSGNSCSAGSQCNTVGGAGFCQSESTALMSSYFDKDQKRPANSVSLRCTGSSLRNLSKHSPHALQSLGFRIQRISRPHDRLEF